MSNTLFPKSVPVTVVTGEYQSGKTVFALTTGYPLERVLIYDNELSAETYHTPDNPFVRVDLPGELARLHPKGYTSVQFYEAWLQHMRAIQPDQFDVIVVDTIEPLEDGLADWVEKNPAAFGHTAAQYQKMSGIFWNDVKAEWKKVIQDIKARCRMVILLAHMRDQYKNNVRTGKRERRGKETLSELATLELELVRKPGQEAPSAKVLKHRFFAGSLGTPSSVKPVLPSWLEVCTWEVIRGYMAQPVEKDILPPEEDDSEEREMEKLRLQAAIAEAELAKVELQQQGAAARKAAAATNGKGKAAATNGNGSNGAGPVDPQAAAKHRLQAKLESMGVSLNGGTVTAALAGVDQPWAKQAVGLIKQKDWAGLLQLELA